MRMDLIRSKIVLGGLFLALSVGCKAQSPAVSGTPNNGDINRKIEVLVRSQFRVPPQYTVTIGTRSKSDLKGYATLPITFALNGKSKTIEFLLSDDGKTLARLDTFDLSKDPADGISVSGRAVRGNPNAKVTVINFDDLECPYCARMHQELFPLTLERYKDLVRFVYKDDPLTEIHPWALHAAVNANCLARQSGNAYWNYVDYLHSHGQEVDGSQRDLKASFATLDRLANEEAGRSKLDAPQVQACVVKQDETEVLASRREADSLGIDGTPSIFVNGEHLAGLVSTEDLWSVIDRALVAAGVTPPPAPVSPAQTAQPGK
jgi:protein-disulfide isomerase